jgi:LysM repeat protein
MPKRMILVLVLSFIVLIVGLPITHVFAQTATSLPIVPVMTSTPNPDGSIVHVVQNGQYLGEIAAAYGVTIDQIKALNGLTSNDLQIGQNLQIRVASTLTQTPAITATVPSPTPSLTPSPIPTRVTPTLKPTVKTITRTWTPLATYALTAKATPPKEVVVASTPATASRIGLAILAIIVVVLLVIAFIIGRIFLLQRVVKGSQCPKCGSNSFYHIHRTLFDRIFGFGLEVRRYQCENPDCEWVGLRRYD